MKSMRTLGLAMLGLAMLVGCASGPPAKPTTPPGHLVDPILAGRMGYHIQWASHFPVDEGSDYTPIVLEDVLVLLERPSNMCTLVSLRDGSMMWRKVVAQPLEILLGASRWGKSVVVNTDSHIRIFDIDSGRLESTQNLEQVVLVPPMIQGNYAVFGGIHGLVFAHDLTVGSSAWRYRLTGAIKSRPVDADGGRVFVVDSNGRYSLFQIRNGQEVWQGRTLARTATQAISDKLGIFLCSDDHNLYAINKADGNDRAGWPYRTQVPLSTSPKIVDRFLFQYIPGRGNVVIDAVRKVDVWTAAPNAQPVSLTKKGLLLHMGDNGDKLMFVDPATGDELHNLPCKPLQHVFDMGGSLLLCTRSGRLLRLNPM